MHGWIGRKVRRASGLQLVVWMVPVGLILWAFAANWRDLTESLGQAHAVDAAYIAEHPLVSKLPHRIVRVTGEEVQPTGLEHVETSRSDGVESKRTTMTYWGLRVGERWLVVAAEEQPGLTVTGELDYMPSDLRVALAKFTESGRVEDSFHPLQLRTSGYTGGAWAGIVFGGLGLAGFGFLAVRSGRRMLNPALHPAVRRAAKWGRASEVEKRVEADLTGSQCSRVAGVRLGEEFVARDQTFQFDLHRWDDLLWAYPAVVRRSLYGVIPIGSSWTANLYFESGLVQVQATERSAATVVGIAAENAPAAAIGYSEEIREDFASNRAAFMAEVAARREALRKQRGG